jgi:hypothetical protein
MFSFNRRGGIRFLRIGRLNVQWSVRKTQSEQDSVALASRVNSIVKG